MKIMRAKAFCMINMDIELWKAILMKIEKVLKDSYPTGTPEIKDGTNLDLYRNIDKFTLKQFETILSKLRP